MKLEEIIVSFLGTLCFLGTKSIYDNFVWESS